MVPVTVLETANQEDPGVREDADPAPDTTPPASGFAPVSMATLAALPPAHRAAGVARLQATAGNAAVVRALGGGGARGVAREPQRCACGGVIGADGRCDRCRSAGRSGPAPASPSEAIARMIADDARQAAAEPETEPETEPERPSKPPPVLDPAHEFPLADGVAASASAADATAVAAAPAPPPQAHGPPQPDAGAAVPDATNEELERVQALVASTEAEAQQAGESAGATAVAAIEQAPQQLEAQLAPVQRSGADLTTTETRTAEEQTALATRSAEQVTLESTQAAAAVAAVEPLAPGLLSPARAIVEPAAVEADGARVAEAGRAAAGGPAPGGDLGATATQALGADAQPLWNCDLAEVIAGAGGMAQSAVAGAVSLGEQAIGPARLEQVRAFGAQMSGRVSDLAQRFGLDLSALSGLSGDRFMAGARSVIEDAEAAAAGLRERFASFQAGAAETIESVRSGLMEQASSLAQRATDGIGSILGGATSRLAGAAETASGLLGGLGSALLSLLPAPLGDLVSAIPASAAALSDRLQAIGPRIAGALETVRDAVTSAAKDFLDERLQEFAMAQQLLEQSIEGAKGLALQAGEAAVALVPQSVRDMAADVAAAAQAQMALLDQAVAAVAGKLRDGACVALGAVGGPCVDQYLPELPGGATNSVRLSATGDLIVPLEEIGVPANAKLAAGAAVEVARQTGIYTVKVDGEAAVLLNELVGADAHIGIGSTGDDAPEGQMAQAWNALTGGGDDGGAAAVLAAAGGTMTADTGGAEAGGAERAEVNAGVKGSMHAEWRFDAAAAPTSCEGVGGMLTLLAGLGLAATLPPPFNQMASQGVARGFMDELQVCRFSAGVHAGGEADLKTGGIADIRARGSAEVMENVEVRRDPNTNQLVAVHSRTATAELDATALGGFAVGSFDKFRAYLAGEGILRLTLIYDDATGEILPSAIGAAVSLTLGATSVDPSVLAQLLPELSEAVAELKALLEGTLPGMTGEREVKVSLTVGRTYEGFEPLARELMQYFRGPVEEITVDGVIAIVKRNLATITPQDHIKLELSQTQRRELDAGAVEGEGIAGGAEIDVTAEHTVSKAWWSGGEDELVEIAANNGKQNQGNNQAPKKPKPKFDPNGRDYTDPTDPDIAADMAAAGITDFGPFIWDSKVPRFRLDTAYSAWTISECVDRPVFQPETLTVRNEQTNKTTLRSERRDAALRGVFGRSRGVVQEIMKHDDGLTPRAFTSILDEDGRSGGHTDQRHILGHGKMTGHRQVALRAAFWEVDGIPMPLDANGTASVFGSEGDAITAVEAAMVELTANWATYRVQLAKNTQVKFPVAVTVPAVSYTKLDPVVGAKYYPWEMPRYIDHAQPGIRELYRGDYTGPGRPADPDAPDRRYRRLTSGGATTLGTFVLFDPNTKVDGGGWAIYTVYPK